MKKLKRLCGMVIAAVMAICCLNLNSTEAMAAAKSTLTINERKAPTTLTVGSSWTVTGTITSNYNITWIGGYILKSDHSTVVDKYGVKPNKKSYNLKYSAVDRNLDFNKLSIGSYYYKITAHDASGKALALIDVPFKVVSKVQASSNLKISGAGNPPTLTQGSSWTATGTITSNYNITWVGGYILGSDAKSIVDSSSAKPNSKSYNLKYGVIDRNLDFNKLKPGTYYYKITAHDASGKALTLKNVKFVVKALPKTNGVNFRWPTDGAVKQNISSKYGYRWNNTDYHFGIDITGKKGQNIYAAESGKVVKTGYISGGYGNYIVIKHNNGYYTLYAHCNSIKVKKGATVSRGQVIATIGTTGYSTGPHVHFEVRKTDKLGYSSIKVNGKTVGNKDFANKNLYNPLDSRFTYSK